MEGVRDRLRHVGHGRLDRLRRRGVAARPRHRNSARVQFLRYRVGLRQRPKNMRWPARAEYPVAETYPPDHIREFTEKSLENLGVETIDLQQFHVWSDAWAADERWQQAVQDLKGSGLIRSFGISV